MRVLAIVGSARKGKSTDTLVDKAIEGLVAVDSNVSVRKINLFDYKIEFCRDCLSCRDNNSDEPYVNCILNDNMNELYKLINESDAIIVGTPLHEGYCPGILTTFLERICWTFSKPEASYLTVHGCPLPRSSKERKLIIILTNALISPVYRMFCDSATSHIKGVMKDSLNAKLIGDLYAGNIEKREVEYYFDKAYKLGQKLL